MTVSPRHASASPSEAPNRLRMLWISAAWGGCFVAIRWGLRDAPVLWFATLRAVIAGAALVGLARVQRRPVPTGRTTWGLIAVLATVNTSIAFSAMFAGVAGLATGAAAVLANAQPLLILLPAWWFYGERITSRTVGALVVGFAGLVVVAVPGGGGRGAGLSLLAALAITAGTLLARRLADADVIQVAGWHFLLGGAPLAVAAAAVEGLPEVRWTLRFVAVLAFLSLIGTALAFWAWFVETGRSSLNQLAAWTFLTPVFGAAFGAVLVGERPDRWTAAGLALVLASLWIAVRRPAPAG